MVTACESNDVFQATYWPMMSGFLPMPVANALTGASEPARPGPRRRGTCPPVGSSSPDMLYGRLVDGVAAGACCGCCCRVAAGLAMRGDHPAAAKQGDRRGCGEGRNARRGAGLTSQSRLSAGAGCARPRRPGTRREQEQGEVVGVHVIIRHSARAAQTTAEPKLQPTRPIQNRRRPSCFVLLLPEGCHPRSLPRMMSQSAKMCAHAGDHPDRPGLQPVGHAVPHRVDHARVDQDRREEDHVLQQQHAGVEQPAWRWTAAGITNANSAVLM